MTEACALNNQAAFLIEKNEYEQSMQLLDKSLHLTRTGMVSCSFKIVNAGTSSGTKESPTHHGRINKIRGEDFCRFLLNTEGSFLTAGHRVATSQLQEDHHAGSPSLSSSEETKHEHSMFGSPLVFNPEIRLSDQASWECFSYVLIYNLALTHHRRAVQEEAAEPSHIRIAQGEEATRIQSHQKTALLLYEKSHSLLSRVCEKHENISHLHSLALLCNLGHLHHNLAGESHSEPYYESLLMVLLLVVDSRGARRDGYSSSSSQGGQYGDDVILTPDLFDRFFDNAMPIRRMKGIVGAAAA